MSTSEHQTELPSSVHTQGRLHASGMVYGLLHQSQDSDWFQAYLVAGVTYAIQLDCFGVDARLALRNAGGDLVRQINARGVDGSEVLHYTPVFSGYFYIDVSAVEGSVTDFGLYFAALVPLTPIDDYRATPDSEQPLEVGSPLAGRLDLEGDADWFQVQLEAGHTYRFAVAGERSDARLQLFEEYGLQSGLTGDGELQFTATESGSYFIEVAGKRMTDQGAYLLNLQELPTLHVSSEPVVEGEGETLHFLLRLSMPSDQAITLQASTFDITAVAGLDYTALQQELRFEPGQTELRLHVPLQGNTRFEPNRVLGLELTGSRLLGLAEPVSYGHVLDDDGPTALPSDPLLGYQWYLHALQVPAAWNLATGRGVKIGVFDQGIDAQHADLRANTLPGFVARDRSAGGAPQQEWDFHGTLVAGVIAAAQDDQGMVGVAHGAKLVPIYSPLAYGDAIAGEIANAFELALGLDVLNNSWGFGNQLFSDTDWAFYDDAQSAQFAPAFAALKNLASQGRGGLGTVVVQSAGNAFDVGDDTNLHNFQNSRYVITVGASDFFGASSYFSTSGASILVSAPGGTGLADYDSILSTDRRAAAGVSPDDHAYVDGTSFSSPLVAGVVALMLEVNPGLGYRDVQQILAYTARRTEIDYGHWASNGAGNWNGGGLHVNVGEHATGFGQVDALAAVRLAASWREPALTEANVLERRHLKTVQADIPDDDARGLSSVLDVAEDLLVERVEVRVNIAHSYIGDLTVLLTSPAGTVSKLLSQPSRGALGVNGSTQDDVHFTFSTVLSWGESAQGQWTLKVLDQEARDVGRLEDWQLTLVGRNQGADDVYVFTEEFASLAAQEPARAMLRDADGGRNTLNAAALGSASRIDLSGVAPSQIAGQTLQIDAGTLIQEAIAGDGNDSLIAAAQGSVLRGMRGDDRFVGGAGEDRFDGGAGLDWVEYPFARGQAELGPRAAWVRSAQGAEDQLEGIERLRFSDKLLAFDLAGHAGQAVLLTGALFGSSGLADPALLGRWIHQLDGGTSLADTLAAALASPEYLARAGSASNADFVRLVYRNVVGQAPDQDALSYYTGLLDRGEYTQPSLAQLAAETDLNKQAVNLVGLADSGIEYLPG